MNSEQGKRGDEAKLLYDDYKKVKNFLLNMWRGERKSLRLFVIQNS